MRVIMEPGDIFLDADNIAWVVIHTRTKDNTGELCNLVWFTKKSSKGIPSKVNQYCEENNLGDLEYDKVDIPASLLKQPFKLLLELNSKDL